jgi:hypothetical protein
MSGYVCLLRSGYNCSGCLLFTQAISKTLKTLEVDYPMFGSKNRRSVEMDGEHH